MSWDHPIQGIEVHIAVSAILKQFAKWGPSFLLVAGSLSAFLVPSVQSMAKAHPSDLGWAIALSLVTHLAPSPVKK